MFVVYTATTDKGPSLVWPPILVAFEGFIDPGL
jgi:hypothetical protein